MSPSIRSDFVSPHQYMGEPHGLDAETIESEIPFTYNDGKLQTEALIGVNDVWMIQINK